MPPAAAAVPRFPTLDMTFVSPIKIPLGNPFEASGLCVRPVRGGIEALGPGWGQISRGCRTLFPYYRTAGRKGQSRALVHNNSAGLIRIIDKNVIGPRDYNLEWS